MSDSPILQQALSLARLGYRVLPVRPKSKQPAITEWPKRATSDESEIRALFQNPAVNLGVACGEFFVLDFDDAELAAGWPDPARNAELRAAAIAITRTPRGGAHFWFASPDQVEVRGSVGKLAPKLDIRGVGNFIMCPPSVTADGHYNWERPPLPLSEAPPAPGWLINLLSEQPRSASVADSHMTVAAVNGVANGTANGHIAAIEALEVIPEGRRKATLCSLAGRLRDKGVSLEAIKAALEAENRLRCRPPLPDAELADILRSASRWRPGHLPGATDDGDICLADVEEREVEWLWPDRFPLGFVSVIAGKRGLGKSLAAIDIAARVTTGGPWPDGSGNAPQGGAVIVNLEDDAARVLRKRLRVAGADMKQVRAVTTPIATFEVDRLLRIIGRCRECRLLVLDPLGNHIGENTETYRDNAVRCALAPLVEIARERNIAVILVCHLKKEGTASADDQVLGSVAFTALARSVWHVLPAPGVPLQSGERLLASGKSNLCRPAPGLRFRIAGTPPVLAWGEALPPDQDADAILAEQQRCVEDRRHGPPPLELQEAETFLETVLANGPLPVRDIFAQARAAGIAQKTLRRAKARAGITTRQTADGWVWSWPRRATVHPQPFDR